MTQKTQEEKDLSPEEIASVLLSGQFGTERFNQGILKDVNVEDLQKYMSSPSKYKDKLSKYAFYQYITNGDIFMLFDLVRILPNLNYNIKTFRPSKSNEKKILDCRKSLQELNHKEVTRDIVSQLVSTGTVCGLIVGKDDSKSKDNPYIILFDNLEYIFPARRINGKWTIWLDMSYFTSSIDDGDKINLLESLYPYVTEEDVKNYKEDMVNNRYIEFPVERSICLRTHTLRRNQRFGIPWNTQSIFDVKHKQKLRDLEKNVANKVINSVAVLKIGLDNETSSYKKIGTTLARSILEGVKKGLKANEDNEAQIVSLPEFADLKWADMNVDDTLDPDKITSISDDISSSTGVARGLITGKDTTYAVAKLNLEMIFSRISELLENIENEVYNKYINIIVPKSSYGNFYFEYEKQYPLSLSDKIGHYKDLATMGYSIKPYLEALGLDMDEYLAQSIYEIEDLDLRTKITPPMTSYTMTNDDTQNSNDSDGLSENTEKSKNRGDNESPKPSNE